jgi:hypothetical protein
MFCVLSIMSVSSQTKTFRKLVRFPASSRSTTLIHPIMLQCSPKYKNDTHQSKTTLFNEWHSTMLHVSIPKESSPVHSYKTFKTYQFCEFFHSTLRFVQHTLRFLYCTCRFLHYTLRFLHRTLRILHYILRRVGGQHHAPAALPPGRPGTHCTGGWVVPRAGLNGCGKSRPPRDSMPGPSSP